MNTIKALDGHISMTKISAVVSAIAGAAIAIQQAGLDLVPGSTIDELVVRLVLIAGVMMGVVGARDAISKIGVSK